MTTLMDISAINVYKLKQSKLITEILKSDQASHTSLCTSTWLDPSIPSAFPVRNTFLPSQTMLLE